MPGHMHGHTRPMAEARTSIASLLAQCDHEDRIAQLTRAGSALRAQRLQLEALIDKGRPALAESARTSSDAADGGACAQAACPPAAQPALESVRTQAGPTGVVYPEKSCVG